MEGHKMKKVLLISTGVLIAALFGVAAINTNAIKQHKKEQQLLYEKYAKDYRVVFSSNHKQIKTNDLWAYDDKERLLLLKALVENMRTSNTYYEFAESLTYEEQNNGLMYRLLIVDYITLIEAYIVNETLGEATVFRVRYK